MSIPAEILVKHHLVMMMIWASLALPTMLWWKESILWVAMMSLYANFVGHFSGWDASRAEANTPSMRDFRRLERKIDKLLKKEQ